MVVILSIVGSCKKDESPPYGTNTNTFPSRKVRYELFTSENFAGNKENIQFSLFMRNGIKTIFDSSLAIMKIEDIPDSAHRIIIERTVPGKDTAVLTVGFNYQIENVGLSWYLEPFQTGDTLKVIRYSFK